LTPSQPRVAERTPGSCASRCPPEILTMHILSRRGGGGSLRCLPGKERFFFNRLVMLGSDGGFPRKETGADSVVDLKDPLYQIRCEIREKPAEMSCRTVQR